MCGLVLLINKSSNGFSAQQQDVFTTLLYLSGHFRGRDGVGVVAIDNIGNVKLAKEAYTVDEFIRTKEMKELDSAAFQRGWAMIGHNRSATRGVVSDVNSHPFVVDDKLVLVHNGTFNGDHKKLHDTDVDSEAIARVLADETITTEEALRKVNAAYALMWYNVPKKEINIIRNSARPLWYMETDDAYIYASEEDFLLFVKRKYKLTIKRDPFEIKELNLARYYLDDKNDMQIEVADLDCSYWKHNTYVSTHTGGNQNNGSAPFPKSAAANVIEDASYREWNGEYNRFMGCAWGDSDDVCLPVARDNPTKEPNEHIINTKTKDAASRVLDSLGSVFNPVKYKDWRELNEKYKGHQKLKVMVTDLTEADNEPRTNKFLLIGHTLDSERLHVVIPCKTHDFEKVMAMAGDALFEVDYSGITWTRTDNTKGGIEVDEFEGLALMHGINPTPVYLSQNDAAH